MPGDRSTHQTANASRFPLRVRYYAMLIAIIWSAMVAASLTWNVLQSQQEIQAAARLQAREAIIKDVIYRRWNADHGGVYVPVTSKTPPNVYLKVPQREIQSPAGTLLTLMNPAYMTRQVHELGEESQGIRGHITSLKPIRPANAPDPWEAHALRAFEAGRQEVSALQEIDGRPYLRLMRPLVTEPVCLKCHSEQGYKVGDVRGGISASVPMSPLFAIEAGHERALILGHGLLWLIGLGGLVWAARRLSRQVSQQEQFETDLKIAHRRFTTVVNSLEAMVYVSDMETYELLFVNTYGRNIWGDVVGQTCWQALQQGQSGPCAFCTNEKLLDSDGAPAGIYEWEFQNTVTRRWYLIQDQAIVWDDGRLVRMEIATDITDKKEVELEREKLIGELTIALENIKTLRGLLPICSSCKKIRDDQGYWNQIEGYLRKHSDAQFSHSICPECARKMYPDMDLDA